MTDTFEDRLLDVLLEEVASPTLPSAVETTIEGARPRPSRRWGTAVVGLAAVGVLVTGIVVFRGDEGTSVRTAPDAPASQPADIPYFTIADPVGWVGRSTTPERTSRPITFRRADDPGWTVEVGRSAAAAGSAFVGSGSVAGRYLSTLADVGGQPPLDVYFWSESDGSEWSIHASEVTANGTGASTDSAAAKSRVDAAMEHLTFVDGAPMVSAPFELVPTLGDSDDLWTVSDAHVIVNALGNSEIAIDDVPGSDVTVRGKPAKFDGRDLYWRETPAVVIQVEGLARDRAFDDGSGSLDAAEITRVADELVPIDHATYDALRVWRGADPERIVVLPPPGDDSVVLHAETMMAPGVVGGGGSVRPLSADGFALPVRDGVIGYMIWAGPLGYHLEFTDRPRCAQSVFVPPVGSPAVVVTLDPTCTA